jgi:hypothetical protein
MLNCGSSHDDNGGLRVHGAVVSSCMPVSVDTNVASDGAAVSYGGTSTQELCNIAKNVSDSGERNGDDNVAVPVTTSTTTATSVGRRPNTSADSDGGCIVVDESAMPGMRSCVGRLRHFLLNSDPLLYAVVKWSLATLLILFLAFVVFGMLYSGVYYSHNCTAEGDYTAMEEMPGWCHVPFGAIIGVFDNTYAYSNCNDDYVSILDSYMNLTVPVLSTATGRLTFTSKSFYTGLAWQCVEYARRYWMINGRPKAAYFGSVDKAADIWNLREVHLLENTSQTLPLHRYRNGDRVVQDSLQPPQAGDIIIYPVQPVGFPVGHVAVIAKVEFGENGFIYVAEQNWGSRQWPKPYHNYSRKIPLHYHPLTTAVTLDDPEGRIIGWMRYG